MAHEEAYGQGDGHQENEGHSLTQILVTKKKKGCWGGRSGVTISYVSL